MTSSSTSGSIMGRMVIRSLRKNGPAGWTWSDLEKKTQLPTYQKDLISKI